MMRLFQALEPGSEVRGLVNVDVDEGNGTQAFPIRDPLIWRKKHWLWHLAAVES